MIISSNAIAPIPPRTKLWRYMDVQKVIDLLETKTLYMARADKFADPLEGHLAVGTVKALHEELPAAPAFAVGLFHVFQRFSMYVSCWRMSDVFEPDRFEVYGCGTSRAAIEIEADELESAVSEGLDVSIGIVQYVDRQTFAAPDGNILRTIFCKNACYAHEQEARLVHLNPPPVGKVVRPSDILAESASYVRAPLSLARTAFRLHANANAARELESRGHFVDVLFEQ